VDTNQPNATASRAEILRTREAVCDALELYTQALEKIFAESGTSNTIRDTLANVKRDLGLPLESSPAPLSS